MRGIGIGILGPAVFAWTLAACSDSDYTATWDLVSVLDDRVTIDVHVGSSSCNRLRSVTVSENDERVEIVATIDVDDGAEDCTADDSIQRREVRLQRALSDRTLEGCNQSVSCDLLVAAVVAESSSSAVSDRPGTSAAPTPTDAAGTALIEGTLKISPPCVWIGGVPIQFFSPQLVTVGIDQLRFASGTTISEGTQAQGSGGYVSPDTASDVTEHSLPDECSPGVSNEILLVAGELTTP